MGPRVGEYEVRAWRVAALACAVGAIAAATLPWADFQGHSHWLKVGWVPFASPVRIRDVLLNVALFVPFGVAAAASVSRRRLVTAAGLAAVLSLSGEYLQVYSHNRFPSATDVVCNVLGATLAAFAMTRIWTTPTHG